jgi:hypothetical protein
MDRRYQLLVIAALLVGALGTIAVALPGLNSVGTTTPSVALPTGCVKPAGGFLIVASLLGFNDSVDHGVPQNNWPVMNVKQGQNVTIVVCNADHTQTHGFQIDNYLPPSARVVSIPPGQVFRVSFTANAAGKFRVYCFIFCTVHWAMQSGELVVTATT